MKPFSSTKAEGRSTAFTLVEIVLAVGVFVVGFISIMALIPMGLQNQSEAEVKSMEVRILGIVGAEVRQAPFSDLREDSSGLFPEFRFDDMGLPLGTGDASPVFTARVESVEPALEVTGSDHPALARATISISQAGRELSRHVIAVPDTGS